MNIPPTSNILEAIKEFYINYADPTQMGIDAYDGLKEKENNLKQLTHEAIIAAIGEDKYLEMEATVESTIKKTGILSILSGDAPPVVPPDISFPSIQFYITEQDSSSSSSSSIGVNSTILPDVYYPWFLIASGGTIELPNFDVIISISAKPENSDVAIILDNQVEDESYIEQVGNIRFSDVGIYVLEFKLQHKNQERLSITSYMTVTVSYG